MFKKIADKLLYKALDREKKHIGGVDWPFANYEENYSASPRDYVKNVVVHRCINLIAQSAGHVPWKIFKQSGGGRTSIDNHPALQLLKKPNAEVAGADFFTVLVSNLLLHGNSYVLITKAPSETITGLYNLHPEHTDIVLTKNQPIAYKYGTGKRQKQYPIDRITRMSQVLQIKNFNPDNSAYGISSLKAAAKSINLHERTLEWNKALLKNSAKPSGTLMFQDGNGFLSEEQFERLKEQFYEKFSGSRNSGKPLILEGGLTWQETSNAEKLEKFLELKDSSARDIAIAFNVPPQLLGINGDNTYSNMQEARLALWEENIVPLLDKIAHAFTGWMSYWYGEELIVDFDRDSISCLTEKRENLWAKISGANFMTLNEKRALVGLSPIEGGDKINSGEDRYYAGYNQ